VARFVVRHTIYLPLSDMQKLSSTNNNHNNIRQGHTKSDYFWLKSVAWMC